MIFLSSFILMNHLKLLQIQRLNIEITRKHPAVVHCYSGVYEYGVPIVYY